MPQTIARFCLAILFPIMSLLSVTCCFFYYPLSWSLLRKSSMVKHLFASSIMFFLLITHCKPRRKKEYIVSLRQAIPLTSFPASCLSSFLSHLLLSFCTLYSPRLLILSSFYSFRQCLPGTKEDIVVQVPT